MKSQKLKDAIKAKSAILEEAMETGRPKEELMRLYKELKELHFQLTEEELLTVKQTLPIWHPLAGGTLKS